MRRRVLGGNGGGVVQNTIVKTHIRGLFVFISGIRKVWEEDLRSVRSPPYWTLFIFAMEGL